jgi:hypothetical protein
LVAEGFGTSSGLGRFFLEKENWRRHVRAAVAAALWVVVLLVVVEEVGRRVCQEEGSMAVAAASVVWCHSRCEG